ncbi:MAG: hypothetical protein ACRELE_09020 [Gemmatimonadales bacterium]
MERRVPALPHGGPLIRPDSPETLPGVRRDERCMRGRIALAGVFVLLSCGHSDAFNPSATSVGSFNTGFDIRLTLNPDQDYWPTWTADGRGILYAFVNPVNAGVVADRHRCMGILPAAPQYRTALVTPPITADTLFADSSFVGGVAAASGSVVIGTIAARHATLQAISGTTGAVGCSLAENGASIVFIHRDDPRLFKVPVAGGVAVVVANDPVTPSFGGEGGPIFARVGSGPRELHSISLRTGTVQTLRTFGPSAAVPIIASPQISPTTGDVVVQIGGVWGHLQTNTGAGSSDLHLYPAIAP